MRLEIKGLKEMRERLERLRGEDVMARALAEQAERMAEVVKEGLSGPPGGGEHDRPWLQSGALQNSIGARSDGLNAAVGSNDPAAVPQEMGTSRMPPRPFLAPVAASMGEEVARGVAEAVAVALKGETSKDPVILVGASLSDRTQPVPYNPLGVFSPVHRRTKNGPVTRNEESGRLAGSLVEYFTRSSSPQKRTTLSLSPLHPASPNQARQLCPKIDADTFWMVTDEVEEVMARVAVHRTKVTFPRTGQTSRPSKPSRMLPTTRQAREFRRSEEEHNS
jgi:phage gpG-like protein